jgi:hypothetical protein
VSLTLAESASVVAELRRARRRQRVAAIHWIDALYQVYVTGLVGLVIVVLLSGAVGDGELGAAALADVEAHGPAALGLLVSLVILFGLRSGSRGGPLALERPDVRHVLLSPVDRGVALRGPALRQLRFLVAVGAAVGATAGQLALRRLPGNPVEWLLVGAAFGVTVVGLGYGSALLASGLGAKSWMASLGGGLLVAWSVADLTGTLPASPTSAIGSLAIWPVELDPIGVVGPVLALVVVGVGMRFVAGTSLEAAERRTALVGQLRFAVTLQDLRTVLVLRRQLAQERPRSKPWIRAARRLPRWPVWHRGLRSVARWPVSRIVRVLLMATTAGLSLRGVWSGTTPLIILAGLALWVAALDAAEPLGQEIDHPGRTESFPVERGQILLQHLAITWVVATITGLLAGLVAAAPVGAEVPLGPALLCGAVAGLLAGSGAIVSTVQGAPDPVDTLSMTTPEIAGVRTVYRTAFPPALAVLGTLPLLAARASVRGIEEPPPLVAAVNVAWLLAVVTVLVGGWVRFRDDIRAWIAQAAEQMSPTAAAERQALERRSEEEREAEALAESRRIAGLEPDGTSSEGGPGSGRAPSRQARARRTTTPPPEGVRGGTSAKPIGRRRDQQ